MMKKLLLFFGVLLMSTTIIAQSTGDYRSTADGDWEDNTTWETYSGTAWVAATSAPSSNISFAITVSHEVFYGDGISDPPSFYVGNPTIGSLLIESGAELILTTGNNSYVFQIISASTLTVEGVLTSEMNLVLGSATSQGNLVVNPSGDADLQSVVDTDGTILVESDATGTGELIFTASGTVGGTVERFIEATDNSYWHQIGVPVSSATAAQIDQDNSPDVWLMEWFFIGANAQTWQYITNPSQSLDSRLGYIVTGDSDFTIDWSGNLMTTGFTQNVGTAGDTDDFGIVNNPFTASLDVMSDGTIEGTNLTNQIWTWDPNTDNYATYTSGTGGTRSGIVAAGQSYFVQIADGSQSSSFAVSEADRVFSSGDIFLKSSDFFNWDDNFGKGTYVMLKVYDGESSDGAFVNFGENGTTGFENGFDGTKRMGNETAPQLFLVEEGLELSIDYIQSLEETNERVVQMNFKAGKEGEHTLAANLDNLENVLVTLEDTRNGNMHEFNTGEHYTFTASTDDAHDRFLLHFMYSPTGIEDPSDSESGESSLNIYTYNKAVYIANKDNNNVQSDIVIYDLMGRQIYSNTVQLETSMRIPINVSNTYLIVKVIKGSEVVTQKVFIK